MLGVRFAPDLDTLAAEADILTLHCPATAETHHLLDARRIALMKPDAYVVNTARGELIDERRADRRAAGGPDRRCRPRCLFERTGGRSAPVRPAQRHPAPTPRQRDLRGPRGFGRARDRQHPLLGRRPQAARPGAGGVGVKPLSLKLQAIPPPARPEPFDWALDMLVEGLLFP